MKTQAQALSWSTQQVGKSLNYDAMFGAQCLDLIRYYCKFLELTQFGPTPAAKDLWAQHGPDFQLVNDPQPGDIAVWNDKVGNGFGHCAIVVEVLSSTRFISVDQNFVNFNIDNGSPCARVEHGRENLLGFLRPKYAAEPAPTPQKSNDVIAQEVLRGDWGNGADRKNRLAAAGYNYDIIQSIVNGLVSSPAPKPTPNSAQRVHVIQPGQSYWWIEDHYGIPHGTLEKMNPWPAKAIPKFAQVKLP